MSDAEYLSVKQLAAYTGTSEEYWNRRRSKGGGPAYTKLGHIIRYR